MSEFIQANLGAKGLIGFSGGRNPLNDQGILISIVVRDPARYLKSHLEVKRLRSLIAPSHLCPYLFNTRGLHHPLEKLGPNAFSPMLRENGNRADMSVLRENDIS